MLPDVILELVESTTESVFRCTQINLWLYCFEPRHKMFLWRISKKCSPEHLDGGSRAVRKVYMPLQWCTDEKQTVHSKYRHCGFPQLLGLDAKTMYNEYRYLFSSFWSIFLLLVSHIFIHSMHWSVGKTLMNTNTHNTNCTCRRCLLIYQWVWSTSTSRQSLSLWWQRKGLGICFASRHSLNLWWQSKWGERFSESAPHPDRAWVYGDRVCGGRGVRWGSGSWPPGRPPLLTPASCNISLSVSRSAPEQWSTEQ